MKRLVITLLICSVLPFSLSFGQDANTDGIATLQTGYILQDGANGAIAHALGADIPGFAKLTGGTVTTLETTVLYSDRPWGNALEIYGTRVFAVRQIDLSWAYLGIGAGSWYLTDSDGADKTHAAAKIEVGAKFLGIDLYVGCDVVDVRHGADVAFPHLSLSIIGY